MAYVEAEMLKGLTFTSVEQVDGPEGDEIRFEADNGDVYRMFHYQDCCESVTLEEVIGDLDDLVGTPILEARESSNRDRLEAEKDLLDGEEYVMMKLSTFGEETPEYGDESQTWTFYIFRTIKGSVTLRWYGYSNGYYSESVTIIRD